MQLPLLLLQTIKLADGVARVQDVLQGTFDAHKTCGNGACAIHSVFGVLDQCGEYFASSHVSYSVIVWVLHIQTFNQKSIRR